MESNNEIIENSDPFLEIFEYFEENDSLSQEAKLYKVFDVLGSIEYNLLGTFEYLIGKIPEELEIRLINLGLITIQGEE